MTMFLRLVKSNSLGFINRTLTYVRLAPDSYTVVRCVFEDGHTLAMLAAERQLAKAAGDHEALAASAKGITWIAKRLAWWHDGDGRKVAAARACLAGYSLAHDVRLLARAAVLFLPDPVRLLVKRLVKNSESRSRRAISQVQTFRDEMI